ncbi:MAG TPA: adenylosuccinate lyase family protein [Euzebyales bacterium]|nr:adenylosuccinate lyase family protein [Euzebyales bacterium]
MTARLTDSRLYGHLWATSEVRAIFAEDARLQSWLDILAALAQAQADLGLVPPEAAGAIVAHADVTLLDLDLVAQETRRTGHSTLGLIRGLQAVLPSVAREHVYVGATVQDITDTWTALVMRSVGGIVWRDLRSLEDELIALAERHRDTAMAGRTHGQAGAVITFGWKVATWADEIRRHLERLRCGADRWLAGQLGGAVGTAAFFGPDAVELRARFCALLDLPAPRVSWLTTRDRVADFGLALALVTQTLGRIGNEIYALARSDVGELREQVTVGSVSSITMPHKRNPERSEHLVTLARLVLPQAHVLVEGMIGEHERDGRSWKAEWVALPEICLLTATALAIAGEVLRGLEVDADRMAATVEAHRGDLASERLLAALTPSVGKHEAQALLQDVLAESRDHRVPVERALAAAVDARSHLDDTALRAALDAAPDTGAAGAMVDAVVAHARAARARESERWP